MMRPMMMLMLMCACDPVETLWPCGFGPCDATGGGDPGATEDPCDLISGALAALDVDASPTGTLPAYPEGDRGGLPGTGVVTWRTVGDPEYDDWGYDALPLDPMGGATLDPELIADPLEIAMPGYELAVSQEARGWLITVGPAVSIGLHAIRVVGGASSPCVAVSSPIDLDNGLRLHWTPPASSCAPLGSELRWIVEGAPVAGWRAPLSDAAVADWVRPLDEPLSSTVDGLGAGWVPAVGWCTFAESSSAADSSTS